MSRVRDRYLSLIQFAYRLVGVSRVCGSIVFYSTMDESKMRPIRILSVSYWERYSLTTTTRQSTHNEKRRGIEL